MDVLRKPAFDDNYIFFPLSGDGKSCVVVDPGDPEVVFATLEENHLSLKGVLITHHHYDHIGGLGDIVEKYPNIPVYGPKGEDRIPHVTHPVEEGCEATVIGARFQVLRVKGHTLSHIIYVFSDQDIPVVFVGDTLFRGGCGRLFEGSHEEMYHSLEKIKKLPPESLIYCAHEYTETNYKFLNHVTDNEVDSIRETLETIKAERRSHRATVPFVLKEDLETNLFLNTSHPQVQEKLGVYSPLEVFAKLRTLKDNYG